MSQGMTIRERMLCVYNKRMPDTFPVAIYNRYLPRGAAERALRDRGLGIIDYFPLVTFLGPPWHDNAGFTSQVAHTNIRIEYKWDKGSLVQRRTYETPVGTVYQEKEKSAGEGSEHIRKHYISEIEDYKVMAYIMENTQIKSNEGEIVRRKKEIGEDGVLLGRMDRCPYQKLLLELAGAERFLVDLYTEKEAVEELFEIMNEKLRESFTLAMNSCVELIWQPDNVTSDMTPPAFFEQYLLPLYNEFGSKVKQNSKRYVAHFDGKIKALSSMINSTPIDAIESLSLPIIGGDMEFKEARSVFAGKVLLPNFPANLAHNSDEEIRVFLREFMDVVGTKDPFMLQVSEDLPEGAWERILPILLDEIHL